MIFYLMDTPWFNNSFGFRQLAFLRDSAINHNTVMYIFAENTSAFLSDNSHNIFNIYD